MNYLRLADSYVNTFQYSNAIEYYTKAINYLKNNTAPPDKRMMSIYTGIAYAYHMNGAYDKSLEYYNKVLMIDQLDQLDIATAYNCIGDVYRDQGKYFDALGYYNKALLIREKVLGVHHSDTTKIKNNIEFVTRFQSNRRR